MPDDRDLTRELLEARLEAIRAEFRTELSAMAKALKLTEEFPTAIDKAVGHLRELHDERLGSLAQRLEEQRRAEEKARDKAEQSMSEQLKQLERTHESRNETTRAMIGALEKSITRFEGGMSGAAVMWAGIIALIGLIVAIFAVVIRVPW